MLIRRLVGRPWHVAVHPGGIVVGEGALEALLPMERSAKGVVMTQFDLVSVARLGLVKIDLLGNRCPSELEETLTGAEYPVPLRLEGVPPDRLRTPSGSPFPTADRPGSPPLPPSASRGSAPRG